MKIIWLLFLLLATQTEGKEHSKMDEIDFRILRTLKTNSRDNFDPSWLTGEMHQIVIYRLLAESKECRDQSRDSNSPDRALVRLGNIETIQRLILEMQTNRRQRVLIDSATEVALPYLMPVIDTASTEIPPMTGDVGYDSVRSTIARSVLGVPRRGKDYPEATRTWAEDMDSILDMAPGEEERVNHLKQWWEHNQAAILEKRYADATWLPLYKGKPSFVGFQEIDERHLEPSQPREELKDHDKVEGETDGKVVAVPNIQHPEEKLKESSKPPALAVWVTLSTLIAGLLFWKARSR